MERLRAQAELVEPETKALLDGMGIRPGWRCADLGRAARAFVRAFRGCRSATATFHFGEPPVGGPQVQAQMDPVAAVAMTVAPCEGAVRDGLSWARGASDCRGRWRGPGGVADCGAARCRPVGPRPL